MEISDEQVEFIRSDLQERGISMSSLRDGLLDHLCCMIESDASETDFGEAYRRVIREFGEFEFLPLQEETTELIQTLQKNTMNKTLRITGFLSCAFIIAGSIFKFMHWPGANILLILGTFVLAVLFTPVFFIYRYKTGEVSNRNTVLAVIGAAGSILLGVGTCFKFMHYPGAAMLMYSGIAVLMLGYVPVYLMSVYRKSLNVTNAVSTVVMMVAVSGIIFTTMTVGNSQQTEQHYAPLLLNEEAQVKQQMKINEQLFEGIDDTLPSTIKEAHTLTIKYVNYINEFKAQTLKNTGIADYREVKFWNTASISEELLNDAGEYGLPAAAGRSQVFNLSSENNKPGQIDVEKLSKMPFGLLMIQLTQWQREVLLQDADRMMKIK
ncbi:MAG: GldL-related protein [Bacteroidia bacterium]